MIWLVATVAMCSQPPVMPNRLTTTETVCSICTGRNEEIYWHKRDFYAAHPELGSMPPTAYQARIRQCYDELMARLPEILKSR